MPAEMVLKIDEEDADEQRREDLARSLRDELLYLDVDDVRPVRDGEPPPGSRGIDVAQVGALVVSFDGAMHAVATVVATIKSWLGSAHAERSVELTVGDKTLKLSSASKEQQEQLIQEFMRSVSE
jgi:Effector Associated Constant Component 1